MEKIKLGELCKPSAGQIKEDSDELIDYIDISSVDNETKRVTGYQTIAFGEAPSRARKAVKRGSVLVSTVRPNLNAVAMLEDDTPNITVASTGFCILDCKENVNNRFIFNFCKSKAFIDDMVSQATGASYPAVSDKIVRSALVPNYSYEEQCQISEVLDRVSAVIDNRKAELSALEDLIIARFVELFGNPITNDKGWEVAELNTVCDGIGDGLHGTPEYDEDGEYPFINGNNLMDGVIKVTPATKMVNEDTYKKHFIELTDNAILLSINGTLGKLAFYNGEEVMLGKSACYCNLKPEINREFVYGVMKTDAFAGFLESNATASTIKNVGLKAIRGFKLILPSEELQFQFIEFAKQVDKSKFAVQKSLEETQTLFDSLMQKYFG